MDQHTCSEPSVHQTYLQHVAQNAQDAVEALVIRRPFSLAGPSLPRDTSHHLGDDHEINDQRGSKERVLAHVEKADCLVTTHEDLRVILIESPLVVADRGHVLDHDGMVGMLARLVEHSVGLDHVVHHVGLGDLLGAELLLRAEVHAVIVAKVVIAGNGRELDAGIDHEVDKCRLHFGLTRFEIVSTDKSTMLLREVDGSRNKGILGRTVDERSILENAGHCKDSRWRDFLMTVLESLEQIVSSVIDALYKVRVALSVGRPLHDDLVQAMSFLEFAKGYQHVTSAHGNLGQLTGCPCGAFLRVPWRPGTL